LLHKSINGRLGKDDLRLMAYGNTPARRKRFYITNDFLSRYAANSCLYTHMITNGAHRFMPERQLAADRILSLVKECVDSATSRDLSMIA
jgi:hypothetical protein